MRARCSLVLLMACQGPPPTPPVPPERPPAAVQADTEPPEPPALPAPTEARYAVTHLVVAHAGAAGAPPTVTRAPDEARARATRLRERALAGESLGALARTASDGPSGARGGTLGVFAVGTFDPAFEAAVASVEPGAIGPLVQTAQGWHVVRRDAVVEGVFDHVLVRFEGAWRSDSTRSRAEARARLDEARAALDAGTPFDQVARTFSDAPDADASGGHLGRLGPGHLPPALDTAAFALSPGEVTIVESPHGLHLLRRRAVD